MKSIKHLLALATLLLALQNYLYSSNGLINIQSRIEKAMSESFELGSSQPLDKILMELGETPNTGNQHWVEYWTAYALYHRSMYEAYGIKDAETAQNTVKETIEILDNLDEKNSEDFALLAHIKGFSLQWVSGLSIIGESGKAENWGEKAMQLGPQNPRAFFVSGTYDYHKPTFVGGGKKAKKLLEKSLELYEDSIPNPLLPSWGMGDAYAMLVMVHMRKEENDQAKSVLLEGLKKFPDHRDLNRLKKKLEA